MTLFVIVIIAIVFLFLVAGKKRSRGHGTLADMARELMDDETLRDLESQGWRVVGLSTEGSENILTMKQRQRS